MKKIIYILILMIIFGCNKQNQKANAGTIKQGLKIENHYSKYSANSVFCLRDMLNGEDAGGHWEIVTEPSGSTLDVTGGDNPCPDWTNEACGQYELIYIVGDDCCRDTSDLVRPLKCCVSGFSTCN